MSGEEQIKPEAQLFLENKRDIDLIRKDVEKLLLADNNLYHKVDKLDDSFTRMEKGFGFSRETGHKTWEAVQKMSGDFGKAMNMLSHHEDLISKLDKKTDKVEGKYDWLIRGIILVVFASIIIAMIKSGLFSV